MLILGNVSGTVDSNSRKKRNRNNKGCDVVVCKRRSPCTMTLHVTGLCPRGGNKTNQFTRRNTTHGKRQSNVCICSNGHKQRNAGNRVVAVVVMYTSISLRNALHITGLCPRGGTKIVRPDRPSFTPRPVLTDRACLAVSSIGAIRVDVRAFYLGFYPSGVTRLG
jgi:hypothetical protein